MSPWPIEKRTAPPPDFYETLPDQNGKLSAFVKGLPSVVYEDWNNLGREMQKSYTTLGLSRLDARKPEHAHAKMQCAEKVRARHLDLFTGVPPHWAHVALRVSEVCYARRLKKRNQRAMVSKVIDFDHGRTGFETVPPKQVAELTPHHIKVLQELPAMRSNNFDLLASLTSLENIENSTKRFLWTNSIPVLSLERTPTALTLAVSAGKILSKARPNITVIRDNVVTKQDKEKLLWADLCFAQVGSMSITEPLYTIAHLTLSDAEPIHPLGDWILKKPMQVQQPTIGIEVMVSPSGSFTDIHADATTVGRAVAVNECKKLWLLWPPTLSNLQLWAENRGRRAALERYGARLEGGVVAYTAGYGPLNALTMPAGTLHCVFTIAGGFLSGINYSTAEDIKLAGTMLELQVETSQDEDQIRYDCNWFIVTAKSIMLTRPDCQMICLTSMARLMTIIESGDKQQHLAWSSFWKEAEKIFKAFWKKKPNCTCGKAPFSKSFPHFVQNQHGDSGDYP